MIALRLLNTESQDKADYLHNQLITDINVPSTYWECAESYLKGVGIYDVFLIEEQDFRNYKIFLRETGNFTKKQVFERTGFLRNLKKTLIQEEYKGFKANCKKYGIHISGETFKTHDYRHTLASSFYDEGVSIQTIRDYLGHNNENMTKQYIDYMPKRIEQANKEYFNQAENLLATGIIPKKRGEKTGK